MEKTKCKAGRKSINDKKELVGIYLKSSEIKKLGGKEEARNKIYSSLINNYGITKN